RSKQICTPPRRSSKAQGVSPATRRKGRGGDHTALDNRETVRAADPARRTRRGSAYPS
ncbi:hypothetical protein Dimus_024254, partial [Dionaea muscipula]